MVWDWIEPKTLPAVRLAVARIDRRWYDVDIRSDRVVVVERPTGRQRSFYLLCQLDEFCGGLGASAPPAAAEHPATRDAARSWRARWQPRQIATQDELKNEIARLHETIAVLRNKRRLAEVERDQWQRAARALEIELGRRRGGAGATALDKFRRAKTVVARLTHPDSAGAIGLEASIREKLFKEFWAEFERIEAEP